MADGPDGDLAALRREIDRVDAAMHELLMERGRMVDRLVASKGTAASGSAFRPAREASMMRVLAERHRGLLPLDAVEGIWRVIISTFTHVQAPFRVHADIAAGEPAMRDCVRFHFGFTVPFEPAPDALAAVAAVAASRGDLGLVPAAGPQAAWWRNLEGEPAPKIIARLPFLERPDHPAGIPVLVVSKVPSSEGPGAVMLLSASGLEDGSGLAATVAAAGGEIVARRGGSALIAAPPDAEAALVERLRPASLVPVGSHPPRTHVNP